MACNLFLAFYLFQKHFASYRHSKRFNVNAIYLVHETRKEKSKRWDIICNFFEDEDAVSVILEFCGPDYDRTLVNKTKNASEVITADTPFAKNLQGKLVPPPPTALQKSPICEARTSQTQKCLTRGLRGRISQIQICFMPVCEVRGLQFKDLEAGSVECLQISRSVLRGAKGNLRHARALQGLRRALKCNKAPQYSR